MRLFMLASRYRLLLASSAFLALASFTAPSLAVEATAAAEAPAAVETPAPPAQKLAAEVPLTAPAKVAANTESTPVSRPKPARVVAMKPRAVAPIAVSRPRAAPYRAYRVARYHASRPSSYNGGGGHVIMLGVAY
jgi:hypothetical protein